MAESDRPGDESDGTDAESDGTGAVSDDATSDQVDPGDDGIEPAGSAAHDTDVGSLVARSLDERAERLDDVDDTASMGAVLDRVQVRRRRRRRKVVAVVTIVVVTALGAGVLSLLPDDPAETIAGGEASDADAATDDDSAPEATAFATVPTTTAALATELSATSPSTVPTPTTTIPPGPQFSDEEQIYTIEAGDSMFRIASLHGIEADVLVAYNEWADGIEHVLIPGETVRIPPDSLIPASATTTVPGNVVAADDGSGTSCIYTIAAGDNPSRIAERFGISVADLQGANAESVMQSFLVGADLVIPGVADCS